MTTSVMDSNSTFGLDDGESENPYALGGGGDNNNNDGGGGKYAASSASQHVQHQQVAGELHDPGTAAGAAAGNQLGPAGGVMTGRNRTLSFGVSSEEFWNSDVLDDQLFEFLMDN
jgi:hypothetical protein